MSDVHTSAASKISIGTTLSAASQAEFEADTYVEIGEVITIGEFGRQYETVTLETISNRNRRKFKGVRDDGDLALGLAKKPSDLGQAALQAALDSDEDYNFRIVENDGPDDTDGDGTTSFFRAKVMSYRTNINDVNSVVQAAVTLAIQSGTLIEVAAEL